jgi:plastocyanin
MHRPLALLVAAVVLGAAAVPLALASGPSGHASATRVSVSAKEFKFTLSRKSATHGSVTFKVTNRGDFNHTFKIAGRKTARIAPGKSRSLTVTLKRGRKYTYICTVDGHRDLGMEGRFTSR